MKINIKKITEKLDAGIFSFCILAGFMFILAIAFSRNELAISFALAGLICFPIGINAEKGFVSFLINGILGQFAGVLIVLLLNFGSAGIMSYFYLYLETAAISILLAAAATLLFKLFAAVFKKIKHININ